MEIMRTFKWNLLNYITYISQITIGVLIANCSVSWRFKMKILLIEDLGHFWVTLSIRETSGVSVFKWMKLIPIIVYGFVLT